MKFEEWFTAKDQAQQQMFLSQLSHNLTVCARAHYDDGDVSTLIALNEVQHQITGFLSLSFSENSQKNDMVKNLVEEFQRPKCVGDVNRALGWLAPRFNPPPPNIAKL